MPAAEAVPSDEGRDDTLRLPDYAGIGSPGGSEIDKKRIQKNTQKNDVSGIPKLIAARCKAEIKIHPFGNTFDYYYLRNYCGVPNCSQCGSTEL